MKCELLNKLFTEVSTFPTAMIGLNRNSDHHEPMHICLQDDNQQSIWVFTTKDNRIAGGGKAMVQYVSRDHKMFACFGGHLHVEEDTKTIYELFKPSINAWYDGGLEDPNIEVLRFDIDSIEIWEKDLSPLARLKKAVGADIEDESATNHVVVKI